MLLFGTRIPQCRTPAHKVFNLCSKNVESLNGIEGRKKSILGKREGKKKRQCYCKDILLMYGFTIVPLEKVPQAQQYSPKKKSYIFFPFDCLCLFYFLKELLLKTYWIDIIWFNFLCGVISLRTIVVDINFPPYFLFPWSLLEDIKLFRCCSVWFVVFIFYVYIFFSSFCCCKKRK